MTFCDHDYSTKYRAGYYYYYYYTINKVIYAPFYRRSITRVLTCVCHMLLWSSVFSLLQNSEKVNERSQTVGSEFQVTGPEVAKL